MDAERLVDRLAVFPAALRALVGSVPPEDARWRPDQTSWSIVEVVAHLADEDVEDFGTRLRMTLDGTGDRWPRIDPENAAIERNYRERDLDAELRRFVDERDRAIADLRDRIARGAADWTRSYDHERVGAVAAGLLLSNWSAHDALHLRQIAKRLFQLAARDGAPHPTDYAGEWSA